MSNGTFVNNTGCPVITEPEFNDGNRSFSLLLFVLYNLYFPTVCIWWWIRRNHVWLKKRYFGFMIISGLGVYCELAVACLGNFTGRRTYPCEAHLWLSYFIIPLAASPLVARLVLMYNSSQYNGILIEQNSLEGHDFDFSKFSKNDLRAQLAALFDFFWRRASCCKTNNTGIERGMARMKRNKRAQEMHLPKKIPTTTISQQLRQINANIESTEIKQFDASAFATRHRSDSIVAIHFITRSWFGYLIIFVFVVIALFAILFRYVQPNNPYSNHCTGCRLSTPDKTLIAIFVFMVAFLSYALIRKLRDETDPFRIIPEIRLLMYCAVGVVVGTLLATLDPGDVRNAGKFDWFLICAISSFLFHIVFCPLQVYQTYKEPNQSDFENDRDAPDLETILRTRSARFYFQQFLASEFSMENLVFIERVENYKNKHVRLSADEILKEAHAIQTLFLREGSMLEVNISGKMKKSILRNLGEGGMDGKPSIDLFDEAYEEVRNLISYESLPRFYSSQFYKTWKLGRRDTRQLL